MILLNRKIRAQLDRALCSHEDRFDLLSQEAGLDPKRDLRFADLRDVEGCIDAGMHRGSRKSIK